MNHDREQLNGPPPLEEVGRSRPLRDQVADNLRDAIVNLRFLPGQLLTEGELCKLLGVSRASLRQALRTLESEGLIEVKNGRGILVSSLDTQTAGQLYEVRAALEGALARSFVDQATDDDLRRIDEIIAGLNEGHKEQRANNELLVLFNDIYEVMFSRVQNDMLENFLRIVHRRIPQLRAFTVNYPGRSEASIRELESFVRAAKSGDAEEAAQVLALHVTRAADIAALVLTENSK